jgi:hypothetical protein
MIILVLPLLALALFFYFQNQRIKRMEKYHERSKEKFEKLLETLRKTGNDQPDPKTENDPKAEKE